MSAQIENDNFYLGTKTVCGDFVIMGLASRFV